MKDCEKKDCKKCLMNIGITIVGTIATIYLVYIFAMLFFTSRNIDRNLNIGFSLGDSFWGAIAGGTITLLVMYFTNKVGRENVEKTIEAERNLQKIILVTNKLETLKRQKGLLLTLKNDLMENDFITDSHVAYLEANPKKTGIDKRELPDVTLYDVSSWTNFRFNFYEYNLAGAKVIEDTYLLMASFNHTMIAESTVVYGLKENVKKCLKFLEDEIIKLDCSINETNMGMKQLEN